MGEAAARAACERHATPFPSSDFGAPGRHRGLVERVRGEVMKNVEGSPQDDAIEYPDDSEAVSEDGEGDNDDPNPSGSEEYEPDFEELSDEERAPNHAAVEVALPDDLLLQVADIRERLARDISGDTRAELGDVLGFLESLTENG